MTNSASSGLATWAGDGPLRTCGDHCPQYFALGGYSLIFPIHSTSILVNCQHIVGGRPDAKPAYTGFAH